MLTHALREVRQQPSRLVAVCLAIAISVGFIVSCLSFVSTETHAIGAQVTANTSRGDVVVEDHDMVPGLPTLISKVPGVDTVAPVHDQSSRFSSPSGAGELTLNSLPDDPRLRWAELTTGAWPTNADQIAVGRQTAEEYDLQPGSTISVPSLQAEGGGKPITLTVVGVVDLSRSLFAGISDSAFLSPQFFQRHEVRAFQYVVLGDGGSPEGLADRMAMALGDRVSVQTTTAYAEQQVESMTNGAQAFRNLLLVFAAIALLVGMIIIANTFAILVAQRRRQIGLLRSVGASTRQVRRGILLEAALIGLIGSALGAALGIGISALATAVTGSLAGGLQVPIGPIVVASVVGVVATVLAAILPSGRAARVAPLEALRPVPDLITARHSSRLRLAVALTFVLAGAAGVAAAMIMSGNNVIAAIAGSFLLTIGVLLSAPSFLPHLLRLIGRAAGVAGPTGRLAAANTVRNPARAASTCIALMLGVGLIVTLQVGAGSVKSSMMAGLDEEFPVDVMVLSSGELPEDVAAGVRAIEGIRATTTVRAATLPVAGGSTEVDSIRVEGLAPDADTVVAAGLSHLNDRTVLAHPFTLEMLGVSPGDQLILGRGGNTEPFTVVASDIPGSGAIVVTAAALGGLAPAAPAGGIWASADRAHAGEIVADLNKIVAAHQDLSLAGSVQQSAGLTELLDTLLGVATALLAVAVAIALIGVGNTLGLSVLERTRESALLRALGLQRAQLRLMLAVEAVLLALVGALVGIAAGVLFGLIGTAALVREMGRDTMIVQVSLGQTAAVVAIAVIAGAAASVLPGRRAAKLTLAP